MSCINIFCFCTLWQSFEDLHKLWFVLYKERNILLTTKNKLRRTQRPVIAADEFRYTKVKRSMASIKHVLEERKKIDKILGVSSTIPQSYVGIAGASLGERLPAKSRK
jgi:hypothetical protein